MDARIEVRLEHTNREKSPSRKPKLKPFEKVQKNLATAGITSNLLDQSHPFNGTILYGFLKLGSAIYCTAIFIIHDADTFGEYTQSVCACSFEILIIFALLIIVLKAKKLFKLINSVDALVNTSECTLPWEYQVQFAIYL